MSKATALLKLIRWPNLVIMVLSLLLVIRFALLPALESMNLNPVFTPLIIVLVVVFVVLQAAAGYIINDLLDRSIDLINSTHKCHPLDVIPYQKAMSLYNYLIISGFLIAVLLAFFSEQWWLVILYLLNTIFLYQYSRTIKKSGILGNLLISGFCAGIIFLPLLMEWRNVNLIVKSDNLPIGLISIVLLGLFSFFLTFYRELIKDAEDLTGDELYGVKSAFTQLGVVGFRLLLLFLGVFGITALFVISGWMEGIFSPYVVLSVQFLMLPMAVLLYLSLKATTRRSFGVISTFLKVYFSLGLIVFLMAVTDIY